ncbi:MAG: hydrogenase maturation nickel metallochaperone HypA [bacterium]
MHEVALAEDLINLIRSELEDRNISPGESEICINVEVGGMSCVVVESFEFAFRAVSEGTGLEAARLNCEEQPLTIKCMNCNFEGEVEEDIPICPRCESGETEVTAGDEFLLKSIEIGE